jgi:hypothetical protein
VGSESHASRPQQPWWAGDPGTPYEVSRLKIMEYAADGKQICSAWATVAKLPGAAQDGPCVTPGAAAGSSVPGR